MKNLILNSCIAGLLIGLGCIVNLSSPIPIIGALLFSLGLITVIIQNRWLYTGKIGFIQDYKITYLIVCLFFNLVSIWISCFIFSEYANLNINAETLVHVKMNETFFEALLKSIGCGIMMFIAVNGYNKTKNLLIVILPVITFIISGFDHCIANYGYLAMEGQIFCWQLPIWIIGNSIGSIIMNIGMHR